MNDCEQKAAKAASMGEWFDAHASHEVPVIKGGFLRRLLLGRPSDDLEPTSLTVLPETGVRIRGATIEGEIDLSDSAAAGGTLLPALALEDCKIASAINLSNCRLGRLSLKGSRITHLDASGAEIGGSIDISRVSTAEEVIQNSGNEKLGLCWVALRGACIDGDIIATGAELCAPTPRKDRDQRLRDTRYALNIGRAKIRGSLELQPDFRATGGVSLLGGEVQGDIWCSGAELIEGEGHAFNMQAAKIEGNVVLRSETSPFRALGTIWMYGAHIRRDFRLERVLIQKTKRSSKESEVTYEDNYAVVARGLEVGQNLDVSGSSSGLMNFDGIAVGGGLQIGEDRDPMSILYDQSNLSPSYPPLLSLVDSSVGGTFKVRSLSFGDPTISLRDVARYNRVINAKHRKLSCYPGWSLVELACNTHRGIGTVSIMWDSKRRAILLDGQSSRFHWINETSRLLLNTPGCVKEYITLYCNNIIARGSPFFLVEDTSNAGSLLKLRLDKYQTELVVAEVSGKTSVEATIIFGYSLFRCKFEISKDGMVKMIENKPLAFVRTTTVFDAPFRFDVASSQAAIDQWRLPSAVSDQWQAMNKADSLNVLRRALRFKMPEARIRPKLDLSGLRVAALDDIRGTEWGRGIALQLVGFEYNRLIQSRSDLQDQRLRIASRRAGLPMLPSILRTSIGRLLLGILTISELMLAPFAMSWRFSTGIGRRVARVLTGRPQVPIDPVSWNEWLGSNNGFLWAVGRDLFLRADHIRKAGNGEWRWRLNWLSQKYATYAPDGVDFHPQPYDRVALVCKNAGLTEDARRILSHKLTIERKYRTRAAWRPLVWAYWFCFDYGLSPLRAILTAAAFIVFGSVAVNYANHSGLLIVDTTPAATVVIDGAVPSAATPLAASDKARAEIPCGESISAPLYAADVFIPLLDLRQESRCQIRPFDTKRDPVTWNGSAKGLGSRVYYYALATINDPRTWQIGKAIYALIGWIVVSLTILTVSGILRYQVERE